MKNLRCLKLTKLLKILMLVGIAFFISSCGEDDDTEPITEQPADDEVFMQNIEFVPQERTVDVGTTVTWINKDQVLHTVTSNDGLFDAEVEAGGTFSYTFDNPGTYEYTCTIHPGMDGTIIVTGQTMNQPVDDEVWMQNIEFVPQERTVDVGTTVTWINKDQVLHTVTSNDGLFDAEVEAGETFSYTFDNPGIYEYTCTIHPDMDGTILVEEERADGEDGEDGEDGGNGIVY